MTRAGTAGGGGARWLPVAALVGIGAMWGLGGPMVRLARLEGMGALSIVLWQTAIGLAILLGVQTVRGRLALPRDRASLALYLVVGMLGIVLPHLAAFWALGHIPAFAYALIISLVPIFALGLALALRIERFAPLRALGIVFGALGVALLIIPQGSLPDAVPWIFVLVAALAPLCYALESAFVAHVSRARAGALQALVGGSVVALGVMLPLCAAMGVPLLPAGPSPGLWAVAVAGAASAFAYAGYVALLRHAGSVFTTQVAYLVTGWSMAWAILFLGERPSGWVWLAMLALFAGLFLVQPRPRLPRAIG